MDNPLVKKTRKISKIYFKQFKINDYDNISKKNTIGDLVLKIKDDDSHITLKIKQALNFIEYAEKKSNEDLTQIKYNYLLPSNEIDNLSLDEIIVRLPPSIYKSEICFKNEAESNILLDKMSSGEKQFLFSMSTVLYHIKNLMSVPQNDEKRVKYKNINIVLDEIELCFHPEYQQEFVNRLIGYLTRMTEKEEYFFNIILVTHSPFILSDIPNCNIMYLEKGKQVNNKIHVEPFGANIHDILRQSFFLEKGFIGDFAQSKIKEIIDEVSPMIEKNRGKKDEEKEFIDKEKYNQFLTIIKLIGEPLIKNKLMMMLAEVNKEGIVSDRIAILQQEIDNLKKQ